MQELEKNSRFDVLPVGDVLFYCNRFSCY